MKDDLESTQEDRESHMRENVCVSANHIRIVAVNSLVIVGDFDCKNCLVEAIQTNQQLPTSIIFSLAMEVAISAVTG
jgi:hypothetical protein